MTIEEHGGSIQFRATQLFVSLECFFVLKDDDGVDVQNQYLILCEAREEH